MSLNLPPTKGDLEAEADIKARREMHRARTAFINAAVFLAHEVDQSGWHIGGPIADKFLQTYRVLNKMMDP